MPASSSATRWSSCPPAAASRSAIKFRRSWRSGTDIVVSPLISLMKDQVDGLRECGYPAAALHSGMPAGDVRAIEEQHAPPGAIACSSLRRSDCFTPRFFSSSSGCRCVPSPSTRRTASVNGDTTSGRNTGSSPS